MVQFVDDLFVVALLLAGGLCSPTQKIEIGKRNLWSERESWGSNIGQLNYQIFV